MNSIIKMACICFLLVISNSVIAQHKYVEKEWVKNSGAVGTGNYRTSTIVNNGYLYVTSNIVNTSGDTDMHTVKFNSSGDTIWTANIAGNASEDDYGIDIIALASGDVVAVGTAKYTSSDYDYVIVCYDDTTGTEMWSYAWNGAGGGIDIPADVAIDSYDNIFVAGGTEASNGLSDFGVVKLTNAGDTLWTYHYDYNNLHDAATSLSVMGTRLSVTGGSNAALGDWDISTNRINISTGAHLSASRTDVPGATMEDARAMATDSLNNVYVTGYAMVSGQTDIQTIKFDSTLSIVWTANYDAAGLNDEAYDIAVDQNGNVYVTGFSEEVVNEEQAVLLKYNSSGTLQWDKSYISQLPVTSTARKMELDYQGNILLTGTTEMDTTGSFFFSQYNADGALLLSTEFDSDTLDNSAYDIAVDSSEIYITGLSQNSGGGAKTTVLKYTILNPVNPAYFYLNGEKSFWCQQAGMYSFSLDDSSKFTNYNSNIVLDTTYFEVEGIHYVYFNPNATSAQVDSMIGVIEADPKFYKEYMVATLTRNNDKTHDSEHYAGLNNHISILFEDPEISYAEVDSFASLYETEVIFYPAVSISRGVFILQPKRNTMTYDILSPTLTMDIARDMEEYDSLNFVKAVDPGMIMFRFSDPNDSLYGEMWWAEDTMAYLCHSTEVSPVGIDLDCAWNFQDEFGTGAYYSGDGVRVGVIDSDGYQYTHDDCNGMYNYIGYVTPSTSSNFVDNFSGDFVFAYDYFEAHGQNVSGIIGARFNNNEGIAGVAHNSTIIPCVSHGSTDQLNSLLMTLLALSDTEQVDVINMCFDHGGPTLSEVMGFTYYWSLLDCYENGRPDSSGVARGIPLIASAGNNNGNYPQTPALIPFVLSVAATNPADQLKTPNDGFDPSGYQWGSSYFNDLDVAAPGECIWSTDFNDTVFTNDPQWPSYGVSGYTSGDYNLFNGTSAATPIVSGIAALILEKDPSLDVDDVYDAIRFSCDKVGGYSYSNNWETGRCTELGYGRVNACRALQIIDELSVNEITKDAGFEIKHSNPINGTLSVSVNGTTNYSITIVNIMGQIVYNSNQNNYSLFSVDMTKFYNGVYILYVTDLDTEETVTSKIVKQ